MAEGTGESNSTAAKITIRTMKIPFQRMETPMHKWWDNIKVMITEVMEQLIHVCFRIKGSRSSNNLVIFTEEMEGQRTTVIKGITPQMRKKMAMERIQLGRSSTKKRTGMTYSCRIRRAHRQPCKPKLGRGILWKCQERLNKALTRRRGSTRGTRARRQWEGKPLEPNTINPTSIKENYSWICKASNKRRFQTWGKSWACEIRIRWTGMTKRIQRTFWIIHKAVKMLKRRIGCIISKMNKIE